MYFAQLEHTKTKKTRCHAKSVLDQKGPAISGEWGPETSQSVEVRVRNIIWSIGGKSYMPFHQCIIKL